MEVKSLWHVAPGVSVIKQEILPQLPVDYCQVRAEYSAISIGTERLIANGRVPLELTKEMACPYMAGEFDLPIKYGYSLVGLVEEGPPHLIGKRVHVMHPHQTICQVKVGDVTVLPNNLPSARAALASNLETAVNAVWDSSLSIGDRVLVVGFGTIGSLIAQIVSHIPGIFLQVVDLSAEKCALAKKLGFDAETVANCSEPFDVAFHSTGTGAGLQAALDAVGFESKVIELSWYGSSTVDLMLGTHFHRQRKQIISSQVSNVASTHRSRWDFRRRKALVLDLLARQEFDRLIHRTVQFSELSENFGEIIHGPPQCLYCLVKY